MKCLFLLNFVHLNRNLELSYLLIFQETYTAPDAVLSKNVMKKKILMRRPSMIARAVLKKKLYNSAVRLARCMLGKT